MSVRTVSNHFTKRGAVATARERNLKQATYDPAKKSSGWKRLDYSYARRTGVKYWKRWSVLERSN